MPFSPSYNVPEERRAYTFTAGPVGCLMLHGFMGSPISSRALARYLADRGITVHCPLLPGHGEFPNKLYKVTTQAWYEEAEEALEFIRAQCDEIFLMGHSMGNVLGAYLANRYRIFKAMVMLAPASNVPSKAIHLLPILRHLIPWFYPLWSKRLHSLVESRLRDFDPNIDMDDPAVKARLPEMSRVPTSGIDEMRKVVMVGKKLWPETDLPVIILQGTKDIAVKVEDSQKLFDMLPNPDKQFLVYDGAGHELMRPFEPVHGEVWATVYRFIQARATTGDLVPLPGGTS